MRTWQAAEAAIKATPLPAAASRGVGHILGGPLVPGRIAGRTTSAMWLNIGDEVVVVTGTESGQMPNGVSAAEFSVIPANPDDHCVAGGNRLGLGGAELEIVRWWNPRPSLPPTFHARLATECGRARSIVDCEAIAVEFDFRGTKALRRSARSLLGRGQGLTPDGDDILVGVFASLSLLGPALADPKAKEWLEALAPVIRVEVPFRTTALSASLLRHATAGEVAAPVAMFLGALAGRGDLSTAVTTITSMGASSGLATACGILLAAEALVEGGIA